ncbi:MAG: RnfABCDGE type electron transport complex subunit D [Gammaproteobacteria bacterium]|nr:RnfABCDGE type electron transport complex subunit D [Gammaproteobacteria bacterium]
MSTSVPRQNKNTVFYHLVHPQLQQFLTLLLLIILAKQTAYFYLSWLDILIIGSIALGFEHALIALKHKTITHFSWSSLSTAMGVMLMMAATQVWIYGVVIVLGLMQKHLMVIAFESGNRHFFNPSNFAVLASLVLFYDAAHLVTGQLGDSQWLQAIVVGLASLILIRVDRWLIPLLFTLAYLGIQYALVIQFDPVLLFEDVYRRFYSVSLTVFVLFMLTDPKTTPQGHPSQCLFAMLVALTASLLDVLYGFRVQHVFLALAIFSILTPVIDCLILSPRDSDMSKLLIIKTMALLVLLLGLIVVIQTKQPYYFSMDA